MVNHEEERPAYDGVATGSVYSYCARVICRMHCAGYSQFESRTSIVSMSTWVSQANLYILNTGTGIFLLFLLDKLPVGV